MTKIFKNTGKSQRLIDSDAVAKGLGAEQTGIKINTKQGPISLATVRNIVFSKLRSTGGRPCLEGTRDKRNKISYFDGDYEKLEKISISFEKTQGFKISPSQLAAILVHEALEQLQNSYPASQLEPSKSN